MLLMGIIKKPTLVPLRRSISWKAIRRTSALTRIDGGSTIDKALDALAAGDVTTDGGPGETSPACANDSRQRF